jgi:dihydroneopterin aldolase
LRIYLEDFQFQTIIGILPFEREEKQRVVVNLIADYDYKSGVFIDYVQLRDFIKETMDNEKFGLLEDAIEKISCLIYGKFPVKYLKLKISKPDILDDVDVALEIEWSSDSK